MSFTANGVNKICFAFNKLKLFKFDAEINSTFFKKQPVKFFGLNLNHKFYKYRKKLLF